jgi:hypothetical protein
MNEQTVDWLLDSDPAIRWQVMQDLLGAPDEEVAVERSRVSREGWGAMLLARQGPDGRWGTEGFEQLIDPGVLPAATDRRRLLEAHRIPAEELAGIGVDAETVERLGADPFDAEHPAAPGYLMVIAWAQRTIGVYMPKWVSTTYTLTLLRQFGADPDDPVVRRAVGTVADNIVWDTGTEVLGPFFSGETEVCVNSMVLAAGAYFGQLDDGLLDRILSERLEDGGWNCAIEYGSTRSSFHTTINVLEALAEVERVAGPHTGGGGGPDVGGGVPAGAEAAAAAVRRRGDPPFMDQVLLPDTLALRRAARPRPHALDQGTRPEMRGGRGAGARQA